MAEGNPNTVGEINVGIGADVSGLAAGLNQAEAQTRASAARMGVAASAAATTSVKASEDSMRGLANAIKKGPLASLRLLRSAISASVGAITGWAFVITGAIAALAKFGEASKTVAENMNEFRRAVESADASLAEYVKLLGELQNKEPKTKYQEAIEASKLVADEEMRQLRLTKNITGEKADEMARDIAWRESVRNADAADARDRSSANARIIADMEAELAIENELQQIRKDEYDLELALIEERAESNKQRLEFEDELKKKKQEAHDAEIARLNDLTQRTRMANESSFANRNPVYDISRIETLLEVLSRQMQRGTWR